MHSFTIPEPQHPKKWLRRLEQVAHLTTASAFTLTILLVTGAHANELNAVANSLFRTLGWAITGILAICVIAAAFAYYENHVEEFPRLILTAGGLLALAGVADLSVNLWVLFSGGFPESIWWAEFGPDIVAVLAVGGLATIRHQVQAPLIELGRENRREIRALGFALLVTTSLVALPFMGGIAPNLQDHDGTAAAAENAGETYAGGDGGGAHSLNSSDGTENWVISPDTTAVQGVSRSGDGAQLYRAMNDGRLEAYSVSDQTQDWSVSPDSTAMFGVSGAPNSDVVYAGGSDGNVFARDATDGSSIWTANLGTTNVYAVEVGPDGGVVYATNGNGDIVALDASDGSTIWSDTYRDGTDVSVDGNGEYVYLANGADNRVEKLDASDGTNVWSFTGFTNTVETVSAAPDGSAVYAGSLDSTLRKINADGTQEWSISPGNVDGGLSISPSGDQIVAGISGDARRYSTSDGSQIWNTTVDSTTVYDVDAGGDISKGTEPVTGVVTDTDGDPVANATVYATGYDAANPPTIDGERFDKIEDDPLPDGWDRQTNEDWADRGQIDAEGADWDSTRVLMHSDEQWEIDHSWPDTRVFGKEIGPDPDLHPIPSALSMEDKVVFSCWEPQSSFPDTFDDSIPGYETTPCDITIQKVDPLGDVQHEETVETKPAVKVTALSNLGSKEHHAYYAGGMSEGVYHVYPDEDPSDGLYYAIAPDGDVTVLKSEIENFASSRSDAISKYNEEIKAEYDAGNLDLVSAKTNSTGHYSLDVPNQATKAELRVIKDGGENAATPGDLTRTDLRNEYDSAVRTNFDDATGVGFEDANEETFIDVCRRMDPVADDVGIPFHGSGETDIPNQNADIGGEYVIPKDLQPRVRKCAAISIVESLLDGDLGWLSPGLADDLADLTDAELEELLSMVNEMLRTNDKLCQEFADSIGASSCEDALEDPSQLTREEKETRVSEGFGIVDDSSDNVNGGGGGGIIGSGGGGVDVGDGDTSVGDETFSTDWNVGGVSDWDDASLMVRLTWSNGTTTVLNESSEYVSIDESTLGADTVQLSEYPIGAEDPAAVQARLDVVTTDSTGSGDTGSVKNPTWNGDLPSLNSLKVSKWEPGEQDSFTVGVDEADSDRFGVLKRVEVTAPDGTTTTHDTIEDGEITAQTKNAGDHRVAVVFTANDDNATEFTEVVQVRAGSTSKGRPPSIRGQSGAIGRYAVVGHGLDAGEVDVARGGSEVTMTGVLPQKADVPKTLTADTTGLSVATDATTTVRLRRGATRQTIRDRINVVLYADEIDGDALVWRDGDALTREGTQWGEVTVKNGTTVDTISDETASVDIRVNGDPSVVDRVRHWVNANVNIPSLPGSVGFDIAPLLAALVALRRRDPPEPPTSDVREHRQPNPQEV